MYIYNLLYIPNNSTIQLKILKSYYKHLLANYLGIAATYELVFLNYQWPKMCHTIAHYIWNCKTCMQIKLAWYALYSIVKLLEVPIR